MAGGLRIPTRSSDPHSSSRSSSGSRRYCEPRRIWSIASYQRDLGVNLAGVEFILQLQDRMARLHHDLKHLAEQLQDLAEHPAADDDQPR